MTARFVVTSLGSIGQRHVRNLRLLYPDAHIGVLRTKTAADGTRALHPGVDQEMHSLQEVLDFRPQAAIVASPASTHLALARPLVEAGIPVLIEKPLAMSQEGVAEFAALSAACGVRVAVGYNLRFLPALAQARQLLLEGAIGEVLSVRAEVGQYLPDWRPASDYREGVSARAELGGGALLELSHEIDYLLWIFGAPATVAAQGGTFGTLGIEVEDLVELCMQYEQPRRLISVHLDFLQRAPYRGCRFIGSEGTLVWNGGADTLDLYTYASGAWRHMHLPMADRNAMYLDELREFLSPAVPATLTTVTQAAAVLAVVDAARLSMLSHATEEVSACTR